MTSARRLPRGTRRHPVRVAWMVEADAKAKFERIARASNMSGAVLFEHVIAHLEGELTDRGVPHWLPQPEPSAGELPIASP